MVDASLSRLTVFASGAAYSSTQLIPMLGKRSIFRDLRARVVGYEVDAEDGRVR